MPQVGKNDGNGMVAAAAGAAMKKVNWKADEKGLYMAGFSKKGIMGIKMDAEAIASDIEMAITELRMYY